MKLTTKQMEMLAAVGLNKLINDLFNVKIKETKVSKRKKPIKKNKWSKAQRAKFIATWKAKRANNK